MKPATFDYAQPDTVEEALDLLAHHGDDARVLAGGQSLAAILNMRLASPRVLVDISQIEALRTVATVDRAIDVGATITQDRLLRWKGLAGQPLLTTVVPWIGHPQTRQRGTVCGSLAHGDPSSELPLALATLGGSVILRNARRTRMLPAAKFQTGAMRTALEPGEMIVTSRFPVAKDGQIFRFHEVSPRRGDFAIVAVAVVADPEGVTVGIGGVGDTPNVRRFEWLETDAFADAMNEFAWDLHGTSDVHATAETRRGLVRRLGTNLIGEARAALPHG